MKNLPIRESAKYPCRRTFCMSPSMAKILNRLDSEHNVNVPKLIRMAISEYLERNKIKEISQIDQENRENE